MEQAILDGLQNLQLTKEEEEQIQVSIQIEQIFWKNVPLVSLESFSQTNNKINVL